jgi:hypothetical protein
MEPLKRPRLAGLSGWWAVGVVVLVLIAVAIVGLLAGGWSLWFE